MGVTLVMRPRPKALCWTLSPILKPGRAAPAEARPAAGLFQSGAGAPAEAGAAAEPMEKPRSKVRRNGVRRAGRSVSRSARSA